ncbi:unnamed protein product [Nezara viridula]|uniref:Uncharacterized protein n=1 Tax=Nezara viridula TaxID=85310 RepID=A0A9P0H2K0_NEZVI|nr:unnamed protein product [Nezara viridula]
MTKVPLRTISQDDGKAPHLTHHLYLPSGSLVLSSYSLLALYSINIGRERGGGADPDEMEVEGARVSSSNANRVICFDVIWSANSLSEACEYAH